MNNQADSIFGALGPGILYAAVSVGASHLVQSTRAGAAYGLGLLALITMTFIFKYPAFRFGAEYSNATDRSLLHGYHRQGNWAVAIYGIIAVGTMFAAIPAVTLVTAGLATATFGIAAEPLTVSTLIIAACCGVLILGGYRWLTRFVKLLMLVLAVSTAIATALVLPQVDWASVGGTFAFNFGGQEVFFLVALLGLMPSSVDLSVWHSLWSKAQAAERAVKPSARQALGDFHVGYGGSFVLAVCFVLLGAGVMYGSGVEFESGTAEFGAQLIALYSATLGDWSAPFIGAIAVAVMFSTVLAGLDGYPRVAVSLLNQYRGGTGSAAGDRLVYNLSIIVLALGSLAVLYLFVTSLRIVIDVASTIMFLFAPLIAWLNHRVMTGPDVPTNVQPTRGLRWLSAAGIIWMGGFSAWYLYLRFIAG